MKKIAIAIISVAILIGFAGMQRAEAQCKQQMVYKCATDGGNAIYLRDFNTKLNKLRAGEVDPGAKWTVVLNSGTRYRFILCTPPGLESQVELTLFDGQHPEENPWLKTEEGRNVNDYVCRRSGMYYVSIKWKEGFGDQKTCAVGILSFVGKNQ